MAEPANIEIVRGHFETARNGLTKLASSFVDDPDLVMKDAEARFEQMLPTMAYVDNPSAFMAGAVFWCAAQLALYLTLRDRGVNVHDFGGRMLDDFTVEMQRLSGAAADGQADDGSNESTDRGAPPQAPKAGEFDFERLPGDESMDWGVNITSCAICAHFSKYDAMDLVPYMCATDDVMSDAFGQGLRRTGTIALGAHHCDFRYQRGGEPLRLAEQYPQRIQIRTASA